MTGTLLLALWEGAAAAQSVEVPELDAQLLRPSVDATAGLWTDEAGSMEPAGLVGRALLHYADDPLIYRYDDGTTVDVLSNLLQLDLLGAVRWSRYRVGVHLPVVLLERGDLLETSGGLGDLSLDGRATLLPSGEGPVGLAVAATLGVPSATGDAPVGSGGFSYELRAIADAAPGPVRVAANLGFRGVPGRDLGNVVWDDQLLLRLSLGVPLDDRRGLVAELGAASALRGPFLDPDATPMELLGGGWWRLDHRLVVRGEVGAGLTTGVGAPRFRALVAMGWEPEAVPPPPPDPDPDRDGILGAADACPDRPEDVDGFADGDGCPDPRVPVVVRAIRPDGGPVPGAAVVLVGPDGEVSAAAGQPVEVHPGTWELRVQAEGFRSLGRELRVAEVGLDTTVVLQAAVKPGTLRIRVTDPDGAPLAAEIRLSGRPAPSPVDGVVRAELPPGPVQVAVRHPDYAAAVTTVDVASGEVRDLELVLHPARVVVTEGKLEILEKVYFETNRAAIKDVSLPLLDEVAQTLLAHPEILRVRVEGHTDRRGSEDYNLDLSRRRARAVLDYLVSQGVEPERLESEGYGESRPVDPRDTPQAWARNRRVEFVIVERAEEDGG